jgi:steroid delta-isomerase-like uncharacterized protein
LKDAVLRFARGEASALPNCPDALSRRSTGRGSCSILATPSRWTGCAANSTIRPLKPEAIVRDLYDAFNERDFQRAAATFAESCEHESIAWASMARTNAEVADGLRAWASAFPDGFVEMTNVIATGLWVVVEWHARGTQTGPLRGEPPTGRKFERRGCAVAEVEGGKIVRYRDYFDRAQMYEPLGLMHLLTG